MKISKPLLYDSSLPVVTEIEYDRTISQGIHWESMTNEAYRSNLFHDNPDSGYSFVFLTKTHTKRLFFSPLNYEAIITQTHTFKNIEWLTWMSNKKLHSPRDFENLVNACQTRKLNPFLWNISEVAEMISLVSNRLKETDYELVINVTDAARLFNFPILECVISCTKALIAVKLPIVKKELNYVMYSLQPLIFAYYDEACYIQLPVKEIIVATDRHFKKRVPVSDLLTTTCDLTTEVLCLTRSLKSKELSSYQCMLALVQNDAEQIRSSCIMKCIPSNGLTRFHHLNFTATTILAKPQYKVTIRCSEFEIPIKNLQAVGSLVLELACGCQVKLENYTFKANTPCITETGDHGRFQILYPVAWFTGNKITKTLPFECTQCPLPTKMKINDNHSYFVEWTFISLAIVISFTSLVLNVIMIRIIREWTTRHLNPEPEYLTVN